MWPAARRDVRRINSFSNFLLFLLLMSMENYPFQTNKQVLFSYFDTKIIAKFCLHKYLSIN